MAERERKFPVSLPILSLLVTGVVIVGVVLYWWLAVRPWTTPPEQSPEEIDALWAPVVAEVTVSAEAASGEEKFLSQALEALSALPQDALRGAVAAWQKREEVTAEHRVALRASLDAVNLLVTWWQRRGGLGNSDPCVTEERFPALDLLLLARVALAQRDHADVGPGRPQLYRAVERLGHVMRTGGGPVLFVAGVRVADDLIVAAERADMRDLLRDTDSLPPDESQVWRALNAEAFCVEKLLERHFAEIDKGWPLRSPKARGVPQAWFRPDAAFLQRERTMVRLWWGERLRLASERRGDPEALAAALRVDWDALPRSLLVRVVAADLGDAAKETLLSIRAYHEKLGEQP